jgi:hypothetical protein
MAVISDWFEPGTPVISDCWTANRDVDTHGYQSVNHTIGVVDVHIRAHAPTIESTWRYVTAFFNPYNRLGDCIYQLIHYTVLARKCRPHHEIHQHPRHHLLDRFSSPSAGCHYHVICSCSTPFLRVTPTTGAPTQITCCLTRINYFG